MPTPDLSSSLGLHLMDLGQDLGTARGGVEHHAASHLHDSDQLVRGMAPTADSASYDTDMDFQHASVLPASKAWAGVAHPLKAADPASRQHGLLNLLFCHGHRAPTADGEVLDPPPSPRCGDLIRLATMRTWRGLYRLRDAAVQAPTGSGSGAAANQGVFYRLVCRQISVTLRSWEAYQLALNDRQGMNRAAPKPRRSVFGLPMLHPQCGLALLWSSAMLLFDLVFTAFWVPVNVAFCLDQYGKLGAACTRTDLAGGIVYMVNILFSFQVGVTMTCGYRSRVVLDGRDAARLYCTTVGLWLDLLAVVPFIYLIVVLGLGDLVTRHQVVSIISLMRLVRLSRVASIVKQLYTSSSGGEFRPSWLADHFTVTPVYSMLLVYVAVVLANLYSCVLLLIAYYERQDGRPSWMNSVSWADVPNQSAPRQWYNALYFSITVMTTTGYADFLPKSCVEQVVVSMMMLNGLLIFGAIVALIGTALKRSQAEAQRAHDARKKLTNIRRWLKEGEVPDGVQRDVITFFAELGAKKGEGRTEGDIVFELPTHLRQKVVRHVLLDLLAMCPPLAGLAPEVRELIASHCVPLELPTGHELFKLGDDVEGAWGSGGGGGLWILEQGVVCAYRFRERLEVPAGPTGLGVPCLLGEGAILGDVIPACSRRIWTICTERPCRVWQLRAPALHAVLRVYPHLVPHMMLFVRDRVMAWLSGQEESEDDGWCEMVQLLKRSFIMGPLRDKIHDCYLALQLASLQEGTLVQLLAAWLDMSASREMTMWGEYTGMPSAYTVTDFMAWAQARARPSASQVDQLVTPAATPAQPASAAASDDDDDGGGGVIIGGGDFSNGGDDGGVRVGTASVRSSKCDGGPTLVGELGGDSGSALRRSHAPPSALPPLPLHGPPAADFNSTGGDGDRGGGGGAAAADGVAQSSLLAADGSVAGLPTSSPGLDGQRRLLSGDGRGELPVAVEVEVLSPSVEQELRRARPAIKPVDRDRGAMSENGSLRGSHLRRTCSAGGGRGYGNDDDAVGGAIDLTSPSDSADVHSRTASAVDTAAAAATGATSGAAPQHRSSAPASRALTAALNAVGTAAEAVAGNRARPMTPHVSPFSTLATMTFSPAEPAAPGGASGMDSENHLLWDLMVDPRNPRGPAAAAVPTAAPVVPAAGGRPPQRAPARAASCGVIGLGRSGAAAASNPLGRGRGRAAGSRNLLPAWSGGVPGEKPGSSSAQPRPGEAGLATAPLPPSAVLLGRAQTAGGALALTQSDVGGDGGSCYHGEEAGGRLAPLTAPGEAQPQLPSHSRDRVSSSNLRVLSGGGGGGGAAVAAAAPPAGSPRTSFLRRQEASTATGPAAQNTAVAALVRQVSNSRTTFIHKIFLAAGVVLQPAQSSAGQVGPAPAAGAGLDVARAGGGGGGGGAGAAAGANAVQGSGSTGAPTILAPACTACGCATCAYCARPIVPHGALAAVRPTVMTMAPAAPTAAAPQPSDAEPGSTAPAPIGSSAVLLQASSGLGSSGPGQMPSGRAMPSGPIDSAGDGSGGGSSAAAAAADGPLAGLPRLPMGPQSPFPAGRPRRPRGLSMGIPNSPSVMRSMTHIPQQGPWTASPPPLAQWPSHAGGERRPTSLGAALAAAAAAVSEGRSTPRGEGSEDDVASPAPDVRLGGTMAVI